MGAPGAFVDVTTALDQRFHRASCSKKSRIFFCLTLPRCDLMQHLTFVFPKADRRVYLCNTFESLCGTFWLGSFFYACKKVYICRLPRTGEQMQKLDGVSQTPFTAKVASAILQSVLILHRLTEGRRNRARERDGQGYSKG